MLIRIVYHAASNREWSGILVHHSPHTAGMSCVLFISLTRTSCSNLNPLLLEKFIPVSLLAPFLHADTHVHKYAHTHSRPATHARNRQFMADRLGLTVYLWCQFDSDSYLLCYRRLVWGMDCNWAPRRSPNNNHKRERVHSTPHFQAASPSSSAVERALTHAVSMQACRSEASSVARPERMKNDKLWRHPLQHRNHC